MVYPCFHLCNFVALQFCFADFSSYVPLAMSSKYKIEPTLCIWSSVLAFKMSWWSLSLLPVNDSIFIPCLARLDLHLHAVCSSNFPYHKFLFFHYFIGTFLLPLRMIFFCFNCGGPNSLVSSLCLPLIASWYLGFSGTMKNSFSRSFKIPM